MIFYPVYKVLHFVGMFMILISLGGLAFNAIVGGAAQNAWRKPAAITHGIGMFLALLGGFGLLARLGIHWPWPAWVVGKICVWLLLGAMMAVFRRRAEMGRLAWWTTIALGGLAAYLANFKPTLG